MWDVAGQMSAVQMDSNGKLSLRMPDLGADITKPDLHFHIQLAGIGVEVSGGDETPEPLLYAHLEALSLNFAQGERGRAKMSLHLQLLQIDCLMPNATFPVVLTSQSKISSGTVPHRDVSADPGHFRCSVCDRDNSK